jgi:hypothetical protein
VGNLRVLSLLQGEECLVEIAKYIIAFVAVFNYGGLLADAIVPAGAKQHLFNPRWPPHAKFHNGQTMIMGIFSGSIALAILFGSQPLTLPLFLIAAAVAANYFAAMACAQAFPGTAWTDPEFLANRASPLGFAPQQLVSYGLCILVLIAVAVAVAAN